MKELIAVNFILTQMGEAPATSLEERSPTISLARTYMGMAKSNMLAIKWWFNNPTVKLAPDTEGRINAPANAIAIYSKEQFRRHEVRPGITGWAQVNGRNAISWQQKFKFDVFYVNNLNFWLDLKIIILTIKKVIVKEGISSDTSVTMEKFTGN